MKCRLGMTAIVLLLVITSSPALAAYLQCSGIGFCPFGNDCYFPLQCGSEADGTPAYPFQNETYTRDLPYFRCVLRFVNALHNIRDQKVSLTLEFYTPDGSLMHNRHYEVTIKSDWQYPWIIADCGWDCSGRADEGLYTVKAYVDGEYCGESDLGVNQRPDWIDIFRKGDPFDVGQKIARKGEYDESRKSWASFNWLGDGNHSFSIWYRRDSADVLFAEWPLAEKGPVIYWRKNELKNEYSKFSVDTENGEYSREIRISRSQAWREGWRILKYFDR
jgi:hypothetical protein